MLKINTNGGVSRHVGEGFMFRTVHCDAIT